MLMATDGPGSTTDEHIFFPPAALGTGGGKRIAMLPAGGSVQYYVEDFLGSSRVVTQSNGVVCYDADFTPFGGELPYTNSCAAANNYKFEGKERDSETGNAPLASRLQCRDDDFGARYYSWRFGRWLSADWSAVPVPVPYANLTNPQTLNLYAMVADDPESFADLDGHDPQGNAATSAGDTCGGHQCTGKNADPGSADDKANSATQEQQAATAKAAAVGAMTGALTFAVVGALVGASAGVVVAAPSGETGAVITVPVLSAGGAQAGAEIGAAAGAVMGAAVGLVYSKATKATEAIQKHFITAKEHLEKLKGDPGKDPKRNWKDTMRKSAENMDKRADQLANKHLGNAVHFTADVIRTIAGYF